MRKEKRKIQMWLWLFECGMVVQMWLNHTRGTCMGMHMACFFRGALSGEGSMQQHVIMSQTMIHNEPMCHVTPNNMTRSLLRYESYDV